MFQQVRVVEKRVIAKLTQFAFRQKIILSRFHLLRLSCRGFFMFNKHSLYWFAQAVDFKRSIGLVVWTLIYALIFRELFK